MKAIDEKQLDECIARIVGALDPEVIYLYGSHAYGHPHADSDVDLLVVVDDSALPSHRRAIAAYRALRGLFMPAEIKVTMRARSSSSARNGKVQSSASLWRRGGGSMSAQLDEVRSWLSKAYADLVAAQVLIVHSRLALGPAAFHCQQAAEKVLKAYLIWRAVSFDKVHNLVYLIDLCEVKEPKFAALRDFSERLVPYAVEVRYPGDAIEITLDEVREALSAAEAIWGFVLALLPSGLWSEPTEGAQA